MEIREARRLRRDGVEVRCFYDRIPRMPEITIALIIRDDEDDIGPPGGRSDRSVEEKGEDEQVR